MTAANHSIAQPAPQAITNAIPPVAPGNALAGAGEAQLPAGVLPGAQEHHPQNVIPRNHPGAQIVAGPGAVIPTVGFLGQGASPLHRSLYG
ncbi:hypothetical protein FRC11_008955 [Ceratobasidium sp. 423]|nr:hypothetical protein FRC11_008955 [Ceratobasidium sp. 423]